MQYRHLEKHRKLPPYLHPFFSFVISVQFLDLSNIKFGCEMRSARCRQKQSPASELSGPLDYHSHCFLPFPCLTSFRKIASISQKSHSIIRTYINKTIINSNPRPIYKPTYLNFNVYNLNMKNAKSYSPTKQNRLLYNVPVSRACKKIN